MSEANAEQLENYLTAEQIAERLGITEKTVQRWTRAGKLPRPYRLSRRVVRYRESEIARAIERHKQREPSHVT